MCEDNIKTGLKIYEYKGVVWTGFISLRIETGGGGLANMVMNLRVL
jgi:hypothetical protein